MTRWGCSVCSARWAVRLLAGCPRCPDHPALVKEEDMPKTTVHSGPSNGPDPEPVELATGGVVEDVGQVLVDEPGPPALTVPAKPAPADVRAWAAANSIDVKPSGPIPAAVVEQYRQAVA